MTNTGGTPAGWYYAPGDPEGTHRYWDGAQWIGDPQPVAPQQPQQSVPPASFDTPAGQQPAGGFAAPDYSAPGVPAGGVPGYQGGSAAPGSAGTPAEWGTRAIAFIIDWAIGLGIGVAGLLLATIGGAIADALFVVLIALTYVAVIAYWIWNGCFRQGSTGQTIGKEKQGIKLVKDETGQPVGAGMAFVRYLLASAISGVTCGIYGLLDYLWPLWDDDNKRLTDKMVTMSVVIA
ncbi:RDD family protein [Ilumatobacter nonamiensis]|uniref:RDD family protein n=1 Tax=Ilumatobacter nonamiensis TaxID=467093 RepID=UPI00034C4DD1|nr:RDD family protein [Ilumatobacter nonamiensis]